MGFKGKAKGQKGGGGAKIRHPDKAVWVGNIPAGTDYQTLLSLAQQVGDAKWAEVMKGGSGAIGFSSAEEAAAAIVNLNGAQIGKATIVADAWEGKAPGKGSSKGGGSWAPVQKQWQKPQWGKGKGGGGKGGKGKGKKTNIRDTTKAVWIGGVPEGTQFKELLELGQQAGAAIWAEVLSKGTGVIGFKTAEDAAAAIGSLNGAAMGDAIIEADAWAGKKK